MNHESNNPRPKLTFLTQWFDPEPALKGQAFAEALAERGFDVEVVTGFPNYPGGKLYDGYRIRPIDRSRAGQVAVTRLALYPSHDKSRVGRTLNYLSFFASSLFYLLFMARRTDVILAYHPPATVALSAAIAGMLRRTPVAIDIQDMWPDTLRATGMISNRWILTAIGKVVAWTYRHVDRIIVLSHGFAELLSQRGIPAAKVDVIHNWADETAAANNPRTGPVVLGDAGEFHVLFRRQHGCGAGPRHRAGSSGPDRRKRGPDRFRFSRFRDRPRRPCPQSAGDETRQCPLPAAGSAGRGRPISRRRRLPSRTSAR